jgi:hypothetical protein
MRTLRIALLAGVAAGAIGMAGAASAQTPQTHIMTIQLPGGGAAEVRYTGDVAPQISVSDSAAPIEAVAPLPSLFGGPESPFTMLDRISAEMDRQAAAMLRQTDALAMQARAGQLTETAIGNLPPGSQSYSFVSTMSGTGVCTRSVEITSQGNGASPRVISHSSGSCGSAPDASGSISLPAAPAPGNRPDVVWTSAQGAHPAAGLVHPISAAQR